MAKNSFNVNSHGNNILKAGEAACLACRKKLSYCGKPFSAEIACPNCGTVNVYRESQRPEGMRAVAS
jgi:predicted RNA-binding Zn-ribbon protein involved in translation (DUF1610 family)